MFLFWACYQHAEEDNARHSLENMPSHSSRENVQLIGMSYRSSKENVQLKGTPSRSSKENDAPNSFGVPKKTQGFHLFMFSPPARAARNSSHKD